MRTFIICFSAILLSIACTSSTLKAPATSGSRGPSAAAAADPTIFVSNLVFGSSVPATDGNFMITPADTYVDPAGAPTRTSGGERIDLHFVDYTTEKSQPIPLDAVRLVGYSKSGTGKVLVRSVSAAPSSGISYTPLYQFGDLTKESKAENYNGMIMLGNGEYATFILPNITNVNSLSLVFESFADNDASVVVQVFSTLQKTKELVRRAVINGGGQGGGGGGGGSCISSGQCANSQYQCINGQCTYIESTSGPGSCDPQNSCAAGENCCGGLCSESDCN